MLSLLQHVCRPAIKPLASPLVRVFPVRTNLRAMCTSSSPEIMHSLSAIVDDKDLLRTGAFIGGSWTDTHETYAVVNPANEGVIAHMSRSGGREAAEAIAHADAAGEQWRRQTAKQRAAVLRRWHDEIVAARDDIAAVMTAECGKPLAEARGEIAAGAASVEWFAEEAKRVTGKVLQPVARDRQMMTMKQPVGVVAAITPWNFPMSMITRKVAPALAAGCTVVLKPSEETPLTALALAVLAQRAGLPDGVLNIVSGDAPAIGDAMLDSPLVRKIGFTGSTAVGKHLLRGSAATVKRVSMELGGNAPFIVFDDADLSRAADAVVASGLRNAGQTCICANRVLVHASAYDAFADALAERMRGVRVGSGMDRATKMGPCINRERVELAAAHVADAVDKGATVVCGGGAPEGLSKGFFFAPTLLRDATIDMRVFREETFAPVIPLFKFSSEDEALRLANDTEYGLAAYFFTKDLARAWRVAELLDYGMVGLNETAIVSETAPFGGVKQSGLGRENGTAGIDEFLEEKYVCFGLK